MKRVGGGVRGLEAAGAGLPLALVSGVLSLPDHPDSQQVRLKVAALSEGKEQPSLRHVSEARRVALLNGARGGFEANRKEEPEAALKPQTRCWGFVPSVRCWF